MAIQEAIQQSKDRATSDFESSRDHDTFFKGAIWAFLQVLESKPDFTQEGDNA